MPTTNEGKMPFFTAEEAVAHEAADGVRAHFARLHERLRDSNADLAGELEQVAGELVDTRVDEVHARLCRLRPDLSDLFALACYPLLVEMPDSLTVFGRPHPVTDPAASETSE